MMISGVPVSPGIALGRAVLLQKRDLVLSRANITPEMTDVEVGRFLCAREKSRSQIEEIKSKTERIFGPEKSAIFEGHILLLEDEEFEREVTSLIRGKLIRAELAVSTVVGSQVNILDGLKDEYLRERASDFRDIGRRLICNIVNVPVVDLVNIDYDAIIVSRDVAPSDLIQLNLERVRGLITDIGGCASHVSIMARSLELPTIVGTGNITRLVKDDDLIALDAVRNQVYINPDEKTISDLDLLRCKLSRRNERLSGLRCLNPITTDGHLVRICANINSLRDISGVENGGADGIGLYRTEFLFMNRSSPPEEEEQFTNYKQVIQSVSGRRVLIRTMDIGGDKKDVPYLNLPSESNPFLGWRAIRICIDRREILRTQLRAILRASSYGKVGILYPMISSLEEVLILKEELNSVSQQLTEEGKTFDPHIRVGLMIETPSAAMVSHHLIREVDFFSIGTNDLTQYTLAVDRGNEFISHLYNPMSPSVLLLMKRVIDSSHLANKWTGMCGELAGDPRAVPLLLGMGLDEFSVNSTSILCVKEVIRSTSFAEAKRLAFEVLTKDKVDDVDKSIGAFFERHGGPDLPN